MDPNSSGRFRYLTTVHVRERSERPSPVSVTMKARQSCKIRELAEAVEIRRVPYTRRASQGVGSPPKHCLDDT